MTYENIDRGKYFFSWNDSIRHVNKSEWDALTRNLSTPFLNWDWLLLLEESGSASADTGWQPQHLTVYRSGKLAGAAPLFIKTHSKGEFVFDQMLAHLASRFNLNYYPKLVGMSPFTPIGAYQFLLAADEDQIQLIARMQKEIDRFCRTNRLSGCHYHFVDQNWISKIKDLGFMTWIHPGYVWKNQGFDSFEDFLSGFRSCRRKNIRRERKYLSEQGIKIEALNGDEIKESHLFWMYRYYLQTNQKYFPWGCKYLTLDFFLGLPPDLKRHILLFAAYKEGKKQPLGMSMLVFKDGQLFGRYWGGEEKISFLHFNLCYYSPIEWAIQSRIQNFDPGMGGEHKLHRGFNLVPNYSIHKKYTPELQHMLALYLKEVNPYENHTLPNFQT